uniref:NADAR domain-containing protein n=1 Tax=Tetranychus urticae TaxID=32264 RepID=T1L1V9_TETUR
MSKPGKSSSRVTADSLHQYYKTLDIDHDAKIKYIDAGHPLDYAYRSPNQITTDKTYDSAQNYYKSLRAGVLSGPEWAEMVRVSKNPTIDGFVPDDDYRNNIDKWEKHATDVAYKANWLKFTQNEDLAHELLRTGNRPIVAREETEWSHTNSEMLMVIRDQLRKQIED